MDYPCGKYACPGSVSVCPITFIAYHGVCPVHNFRSLLKPRVLNQFLSQQETKRKAREPVKSWPPLPESTEILSEKGPGPPALGWSVPKVGQERCQSLEALLRVREIQE